MFNTFLFDRSHGKPYRGLSVLSPRRYFLHILNLYVMLYLHQEIKSGGKERCSCLWLSNLKFILLFHTSSYHLSLIFYYNCFIYWVCREEQYYYLGCVSLKLSSLCFQYFSRYSSSLCYMLCMSWWSFVNVLYACDSDCHFWLRSARIAPSLLYLFE